MSFLNALGTVRRHGQWRIRRAIRQVDPAYPDGRLDLSDDGLVEFPDGAEVVLTVTRRVSDRTRCYPGLALDCPSETPVLQAARSDGSLFVWSPGWVEAVFPDGWGRTVCPGVYDVRIALTVGPETAVIFDEPVDIQ